MTKDPVCRMTVDNHSPYRSMHLGQAHVFCSATCKTKFDAEPGRYATPAKGTVQPGIRP